MLAVEKKGRRKQASKKLWRERRARKKEWLGNEHDLWPDPKDFSLTGRMLSCGVTLESGGGRVEPDSSLRS